MSFSEEAGRRLPLAGEEAEEAAAEAVARAARRRSGVLSARSFSYNLNVRFRIYQPIMHKDVVSGLTSLYCSTRSRAEKVRRQKTCTRWYIDAAHVHHIKGTRVVPSYGCISIHDADL